MPVEGSLNMKCMKCGTELKEGAVFCQSCGSKVEAAEETKTAETSAETKEEKKAEEPAKPEEAAKPEEPAKAEEVAKPEEAAKPEEPAKAEEPAKEEAQPRPEAQTQPETQPQFQAVPSDDASKKKSKVLPIIIGIAAVALLAILGVCCVKFFGGKKSDKPSTVVAYVTRDTLCVILDTTAKEPKIFEVCDIDIEDDDYGYHSIPSNMVRWSSDEKTLYFFNDIEGDSGTLCYVPVGKLGKDKNKNESRVVEIDDNVNISSVRFLDGDRIAYVTSKGKLMIYNGKESEEVEKEVSNSLWTVNGGKGLVFMADEDSVGNYTLFYTEVAKPDAVEIDDEVSYIHSVTDTEVYYIKTEMLDSSWDSTLYVASYDGTGAEEITEALEDYGPKTDNGFFFTEVVDEKVCLYDYIDDPYAREDENASEPVWPEADSAFTEVNVQEVFDDDRQERIDKRYDGDYIEYIEDYFYTYTYSDRSYYAIYNYETDRQYYYDAATDTFYYYDPQVYQANKDKYYEDEDAWYAVRNRISLRESLKDYELNPGYVSLNWYHNGEVETLVPQCTGVEIVSFTNDTPMAVYSLVDEESVKKISIDDISYSYEAYDMLFGYEANDSYGDLYYAIGDSTDNALDLNGYVWNSVISEKQGLFALTVVSENKKGEEEKTVYLYDLKGNTLTLNDKFDDEAECISAFTDGVIYFIKNANDEGSEGDLFYFNGKESTKLLKNVNLYRGGYLFDNGSVMCYDEQDLVLYDKNGSEIIKIGEIDYVGSDVNHISDKKIVFLEDGKLRYYNGKEIVKIASGVDRVWFHNNNVGATYLSTR